MKIQIVYLFVFILLFVNLAFSQEEKRPAYGIFFDNTGSLRTQIDSEIEIAKEVVKQLADGSSISIFGFATDRSSKSQIANIAVGIECTKDRSLINKQIDNIYTVGGQTTLIDAINTAAERLDSAKPTKCGEFSERNLILITDGEDRASVTKPKDLITSIKQNGVKIYVVGLINELSSEGGFVGMSPKQKSKEFLEKITKETGGKVVFPKKKQTVKEIVQELFETNPKPSK